MAKLIDWYVVELKLLLNQKMPASRIEKIVMEAEAHLNESVSRKVAEGLTESEAAASAIDAYGRPEKVAMGFLKGWPQKLWGLNPVWWAGAGAWVTIYAWNFHWLTLSAPFDNFGNLWQNYLAGVVGLIGMAIITASIRAGLRSYRLPLAGFTVLAALLSIPLISYWMISVPGMYEGISRFHLSRDLPRVEHNLKAMNMYDAYLTHGISEYASASKSSQLSEDLQNPAAAASKFGAEKLYPAVLGITLDPGGKYVVPRRFGAFFLVNGSAIVLETMASFDDAKKEWSEFGPTDLKQVRDQRVGFIRLAAYGRDAKAGKLFFPNPDLWIGTVFWTLILMPAFLLVDWLAFRTTLPKRRWPQRVIA